MVDERGNAEGIDEGGVPTRCGYAVLLGAPNVGKSTLLNALVGEELSIVTPKPQTTWHRVAGIRTTPIHQIVFLDTPGVVAPRELLHRSLLLSVEEAATEADVLVIVCDPTQPPGRERNAIEMLLAPLSSPRIGVINKVDAVGPVAVKEAENWLRTLSVDGSHRVSALQQDGLDPLVREIEGNLPIGPFLYPEEEVASAPVRFFVAEMVREAIFRQFHQEIPYACICRVEAFRETEVPIYIQVTIYVDRASQKGILIGSGGQAIRALGAAARRRIEHFLGAPVYLDLWVKVLSGWRRKPDHLRRFGLPVPQDQRVR